MEDAAAAMKEQKKFYTLEEYKMEAETLAKK